MTLNRAPLRNKSGSIELNYLPVAAVVGVCSPDRWCC